MSLVVVRGDTLYAPVKRRGRFALAFEVLPSETHVEAATRDAVVKFAAGLGREGFDYRPDLLTADPVESVQAAVRNFLRRVDPDGRRRYDDEHEDTDAQVLPHIPAYQDFSPAPGSVKPPPPPWHASADQLRNYRALCERIAQVDLARVARDVPQLRDLVDLRVRLPFVQRFTGDLVALPSSLRSLVPR